MERAELRGVVDVHNHLAPGVDDGARSVAEALYHLAALTADGAARLAVSPHLNGALAHEDGALSARLDRLEAAFGELVAACRRRGDVPDLAFGQEILLPDPATTAAVLADPRVGYRGTRYCLVEFGFHLEGDPVHVIRAAVAAGRRPIVAHPERYVRDGRPASVAEIERWKTEGALLQVNGGSLLGCYDDAIADLAWRLLHRGLADMLATDHHADARPVSPRDVARVLADRGGAALAPRLMAENPARVLDDRDTLPVTGWEVPNSVASRRSGEERWSRRC